MLNDSEWRRLEQLITRGVLHALRERDSEKSRNKLESVIRWQEKDNKLMDRMEKDNES